MKRVAVAVVVVAVAIGSLAGFGEAQPSPKPTEPGPKAKVTEAAPKGKAPEADPKTKATPPGDFAIGRIEAVRPGNPTVLVVQVVEASDSVRRIKVDGRLTVDLSSGVLRGIEGGAAGLQVGGQVKLEGVVRDGRLVVARASVLRGK
jgi:hypothetical protein